MRASKLVPFIVSSALFPLLFILIFPLNTTDSMPMGVYLRLPAWNVKEGDIVQAESPMVPGFLNTSSNGNLVKRVASVKGGLYELQGDTVLSYDSDFYGMVGKENIIARLIPLAVFE